MVQPATEQLHQLQRTLGDQLFSTAERLVDAGSVLEVRVLQAGNVVTGIVEAGGKRRVYIQYQGGRGAQAAFSMAGECSCGERSPCVHVAAVSIAAAKGVQKGNAGRGREIAGPSPRESPRSEASLNGAMQELVGAPARDSAGPRQALFYLLGNADGSRIQLSVWVGQTITRTQRVETSSACPFALRPAGGDDAYPRYVDSADRALLKALALQHVHAPWELLNETGAELLRQCVATGRTFWEALTGNPLRWGAARPAQFGWQILSNGDQALRCEAGETLDVLVDVEPPLFVDRATGECGALQLPYPSGLLRGYCTGAPTPPENVVAANDAIMRTDGASAFPRLREVIVERQALASLSAKVVLGGSEAAGPAAVLHFLYNGLAVDSRSVKAEASAVRWADAERAIVFEIGRDLLSEQRLRKQLESELPDEVHQSPQAWLAFMLNGVPRLEGEGWSVDVEPAFPYRLARADSWCAQLQTITDQQPNRRLPRRQDREWFDLRLGIVVDGQAVNLLPALMGYLQGALDNREATCYRVDERLFIRLEDGRYLPVPMDKIECIADTLVELFDREEGLSDRQTLVLPASQATRLTQLSIELNGVELRSNDSSMLSQLEELKSFAGIQPQAAPTSFQATLRPYQEEGLGWLQFLRRFRLGGVLADDMGLGKTVQTLAHLVLEKEQGRLGKPSLIVAPVSVIGNWQQEIQRFAPQLKLITLHGPRRRELFSAIRTADVVIVGYPSLQFDSEALVEIEYAFLILDEAQLIKNPRAKVSQVARELRAEHRLCLTGTPMENHLGELWSLFDFLQPGLLGEEKQFQRQYRTPIEKDADANRAASLSKRVAPFILRRTKDAVAKDLPEKTQIIEPIVLDERQRDFYDGIRLAMHRRVREVIQGQGLARSHITVLDALLKLRQACCDPRLVVDDAETRTIPSGKLDWLKTVLPELVDEGRRILLFSQFTSMLGLIENAVQELAIPYLKLTGETQKRAELVAKFQSGAVPLFLISLKAGGTGLNLTAADTVIHFDPWWNPAVEAQATDRAHRIGQDKPVFVYKLIAQGTVEEKIMQLQAEKHALVKQLFVEENASPSRLSAADLESLFAP